MHASRNEAESIFFRRIGGIVGTVKMRDDFYIRHPRMHLGYGWYIIGLQGSAQGIKGGKVGTYYGATSGPFRPRDCSRVTSKEATSRY